MNITYIHHSGFLVETERFYYLFDYEKGSLPAMDRQKPVFVLSSHGHSDHYNPEIFSLLHGIGMMRIQAVLSDDIEAPANISTLSVAPGMTCELAPELKLTTFRSTDLGVAFLIADGKILIYHAGDLNDWVWEGEPEDYNRQMTLDYRQQISLLAGKLQNRELDAAFVVLDPRQGQDYDRGLCHFLKNISAKQVWPMHYWDQPSVIELFLHKHPEYTSRIQKTE